MHTKILLRTLLLFLATVCFALTLEHLEDVHQKISDKQISSRDQNLRDKRALKKPGFFRTLFSVIFEQYADTKDTISYINRMINDNFVDESVARTSTTPAPSTDPNATTTQMPFKLTRSAFNRILRRNLKGLVRLYNIELRDALGQSDKVNEDFRRNASAEVSKYL